MDENIFNKQIFNLGSLDFMVLNVYQIQGYLLRVKRNKSKAKKQIFLKFVLCTELAIVFVLISYMYTLHTHTKSIKITTI